MSNWYTVIIKETAQKQIKRLPPQYLIRVKNTILHLENNPRPHGSIKLQGGISEYRIRIGPYRILYSIQETSLIVYVFDVDHQKQVYK